MSGVEFGSGRSGLRGMARLARELPYGVELFQLGSEGSVLFADRDGARELGPREEFLPFIDDGQFAHYLVGDARTSPERPSNATVKLGVVGPRSAFTPHAHGGEHFVLSLGHASCGLWDAPRGRVTEIPLVPGGMIRIPEMMPHSFANRGTRPLNILAANTGFGIDHEDYAITADEAERRATDDVVRGGRRGLGTAARIGTVARIGTDFGLLAAALRDIERAQRLRGVGTTTARERLAAGLRRIAAALESPR
ncbi:cupin domain-containing protein [Streptomyces sp. NBC_00872]|uniref:cupin domain-containing protein n=1 Tax=Streptomyces sp. NBC_00872 TaxID=2903686 RepID=UPI00386B3F06|nr:cupin domain-containing protein [Streptomyces sp. NBC_00872]